MDGGKKAHGWRDREGGATHTREGKDTEEEQAADGDDSPPETEMGKITLVDENEATTERNNGGHSGRSLERGTAAEGIRSAMSGFKNAEDRDDTSPETEPCSGGPIKETARKCDGKKLKEHSSPEAVCPEFEGGDSDGRDGLVVREMAIMKSMLHHRSQSGNFPSLGSKEFSQFVSELLREDFTWQQLGEDTQRLKNRYEKVVEETGDRPQFKRVNQTEAFELSRRIWGGGDGSDGDAVGIESPQGTSDAIPLLPVLRRRRAAKEEAPARRQEEEPARPHTEEPARSGEEVRLRMEIRARMMEIRELETRKRELDLDLQKLLARYHLEFRRRDP